MLHPGQRSATRRWLVLCADEKIAYCGNFRPRDKHSKVQSMGGYLGWGLGLFQSLWVWTRELQRTLSMLPKPLSRRGNCTYCLD
jgi:hypothetical protein